MQIRRRAVEPDEDQGGGPLFMIVNPETREAYRLGEGPTGSGPLLFTSRERLTGYAREAGIETFEVVEVPAYVLDHMQGKPHWVDGQPGQGTAPRQPRPGPGRGRRPRGPA